MFVLCSENHAALGLVGVCEPAVVLQTLGGARTPSDPATRATFEHAVRKKGIRHVVVCGHADCGAFGPDVGSSPEAGHAEALAQCQALLEDEHIGPLLRQAGVKLRALWLDEPEGDVYECDVERGPALMGDEDFARMLASFGSHDT